MSGDELMGMTGVSEGESSTFLDKNGEVDKAEDVETDNPASRDFSTKKQCRSNAHLKILVPSVAAGAIIGKGGEAITQIQNNTGAKVKMSKANDFYPGTNERVCLIIGASDAILEVYNYISEKIFEKPETLPRINSDGRVPYERHKQVKILVPNSTAGMIIGKGGSFIKDIKDQTGAFIQVSQKSKEMSLAERCITVGGELGQTRETMRLLLMKIAEDPQSASCPNISYVDVAGPVASAYPTGSPYAICIGPSHSIHPHSCSPPTRAGFLHAGAAAGSGTAGPFSTTGLCHQSPAQRGGPLSPGYHAQSPTGGPGGTPITFAVGGHHNPLSANCGLSSGAGSVSTYDVGATDLSTGRPLIGQAFGGTSVSNSRGRNGVLGSSPSYSRCPAVANGSQSLLGAAASVSNLWTTRSNNLSLDAVRSNLHNTGYSEEAAEEIAHAIHVLNVYGFLSSNSSASMYQPNIQTIDTLNHRSTSINYSISTTANDNSTFTVDPQVRFAEASNDVSNTVASTTSCSSPSLSKASPKLASTSLTPVETGSDTRGFPTIVGTGVSDIVVEAPRSSSSTGFYAPIGVSTHRPASARSAAAATVTVATIPVVNNHSKEAMATSLHKT